MSSLVGSKVSRAGVCLAVAASAAAVPLALWADEGELLSEAARRMTDGDYELAMQVYDTFLARYPNSEAIADVHFGKGVSLYHLGRYAEALETFELIEGRYRLASFLEEIPYWTGITRYQLGAFEAAARDLKRFVSSGAAPERRPQALLYHGLAELGAGRVAAAQEPLSELLRQSEGMSDATTAYAAVLLAHSYLAGGQHEELAAFASGLPTASYPRQYRDQIMFYEAEALWDLDRTPLATDRYRQLVSAAPEISAAAHRRLFAAARRAGDLEAMQRWTDSAERRFASSPEILTDFWLRLGIENYERGANQLAELFLRRVWERELAAGKTDGTAPLYLAMTLLRTDRSSEADLLAEAKEVLAHLLRMAPGRSAAAQMILADIALEEQRFADAADLYSDFGARHQGEPRTAEVAYLGAYAFYRAGDLAKAAAAAAEAEEVVKGSRYHADLLRLQANVARRDGRLEAALQHIAELIQLLPTDVSAQIDRMKLAFDLEDHAAVTEYADSLREAFPDLAESDPGADAVAAYLQGVSEIALKRYRHGIELIRRPGLQRALLDDLANLAADADYWLGWALYRLGEFREAAAVLGSRAGDDEALFLAAWAYYSQERFEEAALRFENLARRAGAGLAGRARYMYAKSLRNLGRLAEAQRSYKEVWERHPTDGVADDALFEYAETADEAGDVDLAVRAFDILVDRYPDSSLRAEALFRSAEALFEEDDYGRAKDVFFQYRQEFPSGESVPAALYWGGLAAERSGERFEAVFMWSNLIDRYPESSFHPEALNLRATAYLAEEDYSAALASLEELLTRHPDQAKALGTEQRIAEVKLLMTGLTGREAELSASVARLGREQTAAGRKAMLELAGLYLLDDTAPPDRAFRLLQDVAAAASDPTVLARARMLLGEYYLRREDPTAAAKAFLDAALVDGAEEKLRVEAILQAAKAEAEAGRPDAARALAQRILDNFPESKWAPGARAMVGEE
jgi:TolA-binding protein